MFNFAELLAWLEQATGLSIVMQAKLLASVGVLAFVWLGKMLGESIVHRQVEDLKTGYKFKKTISYTLYTLAIFIIGRIWFDGFGDLATFLGLLSAGIAIALKDPLVNLAGWLYILWIRPFEVGDRIEIGGKMGDVIDQRLFTFATMELGNWVHAEQSTGRIVFIPNGAVFVKDIANFYRGFNFVWIEVPVLVTFESNWKKAKTILKEIAEEANVQLTEAAEERVKKSSKKFMIFYRKLSPIVYTNVQDSGVLLTIRCLIRPRTRRGVEEKIWEQILDQFGACNDIDFAYPSQRLYFNPLEGKTGAREPLRSDLYGALVDDLDGQVSHNDLVLPHNVSSSKED